MAPRDAIQGLQAAMNAAVLGQARAVERMVIGLLADGHLLIEGLPGLAKTRAVKAMARHMKADFSRIQFTPDLLPSDVTGTDVYVSEGAEGGSFRFQPGPIFGNVILADEINRAPAKVQAALLEAMEERQVTVGETTHPLPRLFITMATQNPIEQEGTYPLPEAQTDRFLMKVLVDYPSPEDELGVLHLVRGEEQAAVAEQTETGSGEKKPEAESIALDDIFAARREIAALHVAPEIERYVIDIVNATRRPAEYDESLGREIELGASPRASLALDRCGRAHAWLAARDFVSPEDIQAIAPDVLRHRVALSYEARGAGRGADAVLGDLLKLVAVA